MRKTIIAGNWKMNHTGAQVKSVLTELVADMALGVKPEVVVAPVFPYLETAVQLTQGTAVHIAAQNMHFEKYHRPCWSISVWNT